MAVNNFKVEPEFEEDIKPLYLNQSLIITDEVNYVTSSEESNITNNKEVECHVYYPAADSETVTLQAEDQDDPLAETAEWTDYEQINVDNELVTLENLPQEESDAFSIIDPIEIVESDPGWIKVESELENVSEDIKPTVNQFAGAKRKRKRSPDQDLSEDLTYFEPSKKIRLGKELNPANVVFKELVVNIGPKLPRCFLPKNKPITSQTTNTMCQDPVALKEHKKEHVVLKIYSCTNCDHKCTNFHSHEEHVSTCLSETSNTVLNYSIHNSTPKKGCYCCEVCSFKFRSEQNLIVHENKHVIEKLFKCYICETDFFTIDKLRDHFVTEHKSMEKAFACNICEYNSFNYHHIKDHMFTHNMDKYLYCYLCKKNFEDFTECNKHFLNKHKKIPQRKPFSLVSQKYNKKEKTVSNNNLKEDEEKFTELKSSFVTKTILINNVFHCNGCVYKFLKYENLAYHKKNHLNVSAPYKCRICAFESLCVVEIKKHLLTHSGHKITIACNVCKTLLSGRQIKLHSVLHIDDGLYCFSCSENYENTQAYKQHLSSKHGTTISKLNSCNQCCFKHPNADIVKKHTKRHHWKRKDSNGLNINHSYKAVKRKQNNYLKSKNISRVCSLDSGKPALQDLTKNNKVKNLSITTMSKAEVSLNDNSQALEERNNFKSEINSCKPNCLIFTFKCNKCSFQCTQVDTLEIHDTLVHASLKHLFKCHVCNWETPSLKLYFQHTSHGGSRKYSCSYCHFESFNQTRFAKHVTKHNFKCCPHCEFKCKYFQTLKHHLARQHKPGNEPFSCSLCPYNTARRGNLSTHCIKFHTQEFPSLRLPIPRNMLNPTANGCGLCSFKPVKVTALKRHVPRHFVNGSFNKEKILGQQSKLHRSVRPEGIKEQTSNQLATSRKTETNHEMSIYLHCSQCPYKNRDRRNVANHLFKKHNIRGGIKNNMIVKGNELPLQNKKIKAKKKVAICTETESNKTQKANKQIDLNKASGNSRLGNQKINVLKHFNDTGGENVSRSKTKNRFKPLTKHACNFCPYTCFRAYDMKRHKQAKHFASGPIEWRNTEVNQVPKKIKHSRQFYKNDQEIQRQETVKKESAISKNGIVYYCSQCNLKSVNLKTVSRHLLHIHNIHGGLRNHMIKKVCATLPKTSENNKTGSNNEKGVSAGIAVQNRISKPNKLILKKTVSTGLKPKRFKSCYERCFKCNIHLMYSSAQIEHKRIGHKAFWDKPYFCTNPKCGSRFTQKHSLSRHIIESCSVNSSKHTTDSCTVKRIDEYSSEKPISDDESFSCGECDYVTMDVTDLVQHMLIHSGITDD